jgi:DNA polymerase III subunit chi
MPARVDFYVLESADERALHVYACRVIEKAFLQKLTVCVNLDTRAAAEAFDALLWTFADRSFVPHALAADAGAATGAPPAMPVQLACRAAIAADLLVNLAADAPEFHAGYARLADFVDSEAGRREAGRRRFAYYRDHGSVPETHRVAG